MEFTIIFQLILWNVGSIYTVEFSLLIHNCTRYIITFHVADTVEWGKGITFHVDDTVNRESACGMTVHVEFTIVL